MSVINGTSIDLPAGGLCPLPELRLAHMPETDGFQESPPVCWNSLAAQWDREAGTSFDGQYVPETGEVLSTPTFSPQDTYIQGTGGMSGRAFDVGGTSTSKHILSPEYQNNGLFFPSTTAGATFTALDHAVYSTNGLKHAHVLLRRGFASIGSTGAGQPKPYTYLELAKGDSTNLRIAVEWGSFIRLDYSADGGTNWQNGVSVCKEVAWADAYLAQNHNSIHFYIIPDRQNNLIKIRIGNSGHFLKFAPPRPLDNPDPNATGKLPQNERYYLTGQSGWCQFWVWPLDYSDPLILNKSPRSVPSNLDLSQMQFAYNGVGRTDADQTVTIEPEIDENNRLSFKATAQSNDTTQPATFSDIFFYIPSVWRDDSLNPYPATGPNLYLPPLQFVHEFATFDERTRLVSRHADVRINNWKGAFTGAYGEYAAVLNNSNGLASAQRIRGMLAGGYRVSGNDVENVVDATIWGGEYKLNKTINQELLLDDWALPSAVHLALDGAQIHPKFRQGIPFWPYGRVKAADNCPWPTLPRGTGNNPKFHFMPDATWLQVLLELAADGLPTPDNRFLPFWTGTDNVGQWFFDTFDTYALPLTVEFNDYDPTGYRRIMDIEVSTNANDVRTAIDFQGQDPFTGELLYLHVDLPQNIPILGRRVEWFERAGRWCSPGYLATIAKSAAILCSLPTQTIAIKVPYDPSFQPGMLFLCSEQWKLGRTGFFVALGVEALTGVYPDGRQVCEMIVTGRAAENLTAY